MHQAQTSLSLGIKQADEGRLGFAVKSGKAVETGCVKSKGQGLFQGGLQASAGQRAEFLFGNLKFLNGINLAKSRTKLQGNAQQLQ